ncbi:MAG: bifunctional riboflavin kinase/FMN adenylyltransferase, partial [Helicobacter sp.]|nr:bifunctional riboflavin kinase/FMN adenylyltransferase [Helicobacter sp.]
MQNLFSISHDDNVTSLAIGKFDGLHRAHRALFASLGAGGAVLVVQIPKQILSSIAMKQELI